MDTTTQDGAVSQQGKNTQLIQDEESGAVSQHDIKTEDDKLDAVSQQESDHYSDRSRRLKHLTLKGQGQYAYNVQKYVTKLARLQRHMEDRLLSIDQAESSETKTLTINALSNDYAEYAELHAGFIDYLHRTFTSESLREADSQKIIMNGVQDKIAPYLEMKSSIKVEPTTDRVSVKREKIGSDRLSRHSLSHSKVKYRRSSRRSSASVTSDIFIQQKIKAEVARKKLEFIDRENEVMHEKAKLRADSLVKRVVIDGKLKRLKAEEDTAIAEVGVKILEDLPDDGGSDGESDWNSFHTSRYVENQNTLLKSGYTYPPDKLNTHSKKMSTNGNPRDSDIHQSQRQSEMARSTHGDTRKLTVNSQTDISSASVASGPAKSTVIHSNKLNPQAESFKPRTETSTKGASEPKSGADLNQAFVDMTNFMTKKSLIMDRVKPFTGDSEHYLG